MHIILGGGIAGCYIGLQLLKQNIPFLILEKSDPYGKQISIPTIDGQVIELGSSVFHTNQPKLLSLIKELNMESLVHPQHEKMKAIYVYPGFHQEEAKYRFQQLKKVVKQESLKNNHSFETLDQLCRRILNHEEYSIITGCWEDYYKVCDQNAYYVFHSISGTWCNIKGGFQQILDRSIELLKPFIYYNHQITKLKYKSKSNLWKIECKNRQIYSTSHLYFTIHSRAASIVEIIGCDRLRTYLNCGQYISCMRAYVILKREIHTNVVSISGPPDDNAWPCKYTLQISPRVWLFSYLDGNLAIELSKNISGLADKWIHSMNRELNLDLSLNDIESIEGSVWKDAYTILKPEYYKRIQSFNIKHEFREYGVICTTLPDPDNQSWIEGSLINI